MCVVGLFKVAVVVVVVTVVVCVERKFGGAGAAKAMVVRVLMRTDW